MSEISHTIEGTVSLVPVSGKVFYIETQDLRSKDSDTTIATIVREVHFSAVPPHEIKHLHAGAKCTWIFYEDGSSTIVFSRPQTKEEEAEQMIQAAEHMADMFGWK